MATVAQSNARIPNTLREIVSRPDAEACVVTVLREASSAILAIYNRGPVLAEQKECGSPVTEADLASAAVIERALVAHFGLPVVCEEGDYREADKHGAFWLVDPLDGTKEFLARNGEFTINIALVSQGRPVFGAIAIPVTGEIYLAIEGEGAYRIPPTVNLGPTSMSTASGCIRISNARAGTELVAAVSRSHGLGAADGYLEAIGVTSTLCCGSAIKFCRVAEGQCDVYVRFGRTMEWDTAAGHCILNESGCKVLEAATGLPLQYGKEGFANPSFIATRADLDLPRTGK